MTAESANHEEFERLAMPLFDALYNFARWLTRDQSEAEDLVQEAFVKGLRGFASFEPGTDFRAWMFRIVRNTFLTSRTGLQAKMTVPLEPEDEESAAVELQTPETIALASATREALQSALERLPVAYREVVLLCDVEEMKYQEIAEVLSVPIGTVMSRIARGRKLLRQMLAGERGERSGARTTARGKLDPA